MTRMMSLVIYVVDSPASSRSKTPTRGSAGISGHAACMKTPECVADVCLSPKPRSWWSDRYSSGVHGSARENASIDLTRGKNRPMDRSIKGQATEEHESGNVPG